MVHLRYKDVLSRIHCSNGYCDLLFLRQEKVWGPGSIDWSSDLCSSDVLAVARGFWLFLGGCGYYCWVWVWVWVLAVTRGFWLLLGGFGCY